MPTCPKCSFELLPDAVDCPACGIVLAKYRPPGSTEPPREAAPPAPPPLPLDTLVAHPPLSPSTFDALRMVRPWIRFLAIYGIVVLVIMVLAGVAVLLRGLTEPKLLPIGAVYLFYGAIGFAIVLPLLRSAQALRDMPQLGAIFAVEHFITHQVVFWRRTGILTATMLLIAAGLLALAAVFGGLAALLR